MNISNIMLGALAAFTLPLNMAALVTLNTEPQAVDAISLNGGYDQECHGYEIGSIATWQDAARYVNATWPNMPIKGSPS